MSAPPEGEVHRVGDRVFRVISRPGTGPAVLLLGGCGVPGFVWAGVEHRLAGRRLLRIERPGMAGTPWPGRAPHLAEEVATIVAALRSVDGPAVIVAHSMAAFHAEALGREHPDLVAGLVLLDPSVERAAKRVATDRSVLGLARSMPRLFRVPLLGGLPAAVAVRLMNAQCHDGLPAGMRAQARRTFSAPDAVAAVFAELAAYPAQAGDLARLRSRGVWPDRPAIVLSAMDGPLAGREHLAHTWLAKVLDAEHRSLDDSRHLMMVDRPDAVTDAVHRLIARIETA